MWRITPMITNVRKLDIVNTLMRETFVNQRMVAESTGYSLGAVNKCMKELALEGYIDESGALTPKAERDFGSCKPSSAVILAAGYGMRMVPINTEVSKGLLKVRGEVLIERHIRHLQEAGIREIYVIVGFMKERYEYLIDKFGVDLIINSEYASKNNLHSLRLAAEHINNTYIVPCDIWCAENPFGKRELYPWYMVNDRVTEDSDVRVNRKMQLTRVRKNEQGNEMIGISYVFGDVAAELKRRLCAMDADPDYDNVFWEEALYDPDRILTYARVVSSEKAVEINTYEQLRMLDENSDNLKTDAIEVICSALNASAEEIVDITVLKKGMTNRSFLFRCRDKKYIMRIPGEGTGELINRAEEAEVYKTIADVNICDDIAYINPDSGYKITEYLDDARVCDPDNVDDLKKCMVRLRGFHEMKLKVAHTFDIFERIEFYQSLWGNTPSAYVDYGKTKKEVFSLRQYIDTHKAEYVLTHIDAVPDNFLFADNDRELRLIDWEYAGMQDPHVDVAMFCIYALYDRRRVDRLIDLYFSEGCTKENRLKIYCYISACGLLWSNWCEYKRNLGVEFGEYSLRQYRYAKDYYRIVMSELNDGGDA